MPRTTRCTKPTSNPQGGGLDVEALLGPMADRRSDEGFLIQASLHLVEHFLQEPESLSRLDKAPIVTTIMRAMQDHPQNASLQANLLAVIGQCLQDSRPYLNLFIREGGMELVLAAITRHKTSLQVQMNACMMLSLAEDDILALRQTTTRALARAVVAAMDYHVQYIPGTGDNKNAHDEAGNEMKTCALIDPETNQLVNVATLDAVAGVMQVMALLKMLMETLTRLKSEMDQAIADESIAAVVKVMRACASEEVLQACGCHAISELATVA